jgi:hypothetical protein
VAGIAQLHGDGEIEPGGSPAKTGNAHDASVSVRASPPRLPQGRIYFKYELSRIPAGSEVFSRLRIWPEAARAIFWRNCALFALRKARRGLLTEVFCALMIEKNISAVRPGDRSAAGCVMGRR